MAFPPLRRVGKLVVAASELLGGGGGSSAEPEAMPAGREGSRCGEDLVGRPDELLSDRRVFRGGRGGLEIGGETLWRDRTGLLSRWKTKTLASTRARTVMDFFAGGKRRAADPGASWKKL
jgi:hypothetical protein